MQVDEDSLTDAGFDAFYRDRFPYFLGLVRSRAPGLTKADAEDIVQESFIDLMHKWTTADKPMGLMTVICTRRLTKARERAHRLLPVEPCVLEHRLPVGADPADEVAGRDEARLLLRLKHPDGAAAIMALSGDVPALHAMASEARLSKREAQKILSQLRRYVPAAAQNVPLSLEAERDHAINLLAPRQQEVYRLARAGVRAVEIAGRLGISQDNARVSLNLARRALRTTLADAGIPAELIEGLLRFGEIRCCGAKRCNRCQGRGSITVAEARERGDFYSGTRGFETLYLPAIPRVMLRTNKRGQIVPPVPDHQRRPTTRLMVKMIGGSSPGAMANFDVRFRGEWAECYTHLGLLLERHMTRASGESRELTIDANSFWTHLLMGWCPGATSRRSHATEPQH